MKFLKHLSLLLILIFFTNANLLYAQEQPSEVLRGKALCDEINKVFKKNKIKTTIYNLVSSGENQFPYNISIDNNVPDSNDRLIFILNAQDAINNLELLITTQEKLKAQNYSSSIFIAFGDNLFFPRYHTINGTRLYINSLDTNVNNIAYNLQFNKPKNTLVSGTRGYTSPAWMIRQTYDAFHSNSLKLDFPFLYISQVSKFRFESDRTLSSFLEEDIPAITVAFEEQEEGSENISKILDYFIEDFENSCRKECDYHSLMLNIGNSTIWISEYTIIQIIIGLVLISLAFIIILGYINVIIKNQNWSGVLKNWYVLPATYALSVLGFLAGKGLYLLLYNRSFENRSVFGITILEISFAVVFVSIFTVLEMLFHKKRYSERSVDILLLLITFLNQFIFCFADISLFPIFFLICIVSIISLLFKNNWLHMFLFVLMLFILYLYANFLYNKSNAESLRLFLITSKPLPYIMSFLLMPLYMMWIRIITAIEYNFQKKKITMLAIGVSVVIFISGLMLFNALVFSKTETSSRFTRVLPVTETNEEFDFTCKEARVFGELVRTIKFKSEKEPVLVQVTMEGSTTLPLLYSEYDNGIDSTTKSYFSIPLYPGKSMSFSYGSSEEKHKIQVSAIYETENQNEYYLVTKEMEIGQ